jgi:hypothetical protein
VSHLPYVCVENLKIILKEKKEITMFEKETKEMEILRDNLKELLKQLNKMKVLLGVGSENN